MLKERSKKKPGAVAGAADGIRKFVARGGNAEKKVIYPKWNIYVTVLKFLQRGINKVKCFTITCIILVQEHMQLYL